MARPGLSRGSISDRRFIEDAANNYIVEAFVDVSSVAPGSGLPAATDEQQYIVDAGSGSELGGWGTITGLTDKCIIKYNAIAAEWQVVFAPVAAEQGATAYDKDSDTIFSFDGTDWNIASGAGGGVKNFAQTMASGYKVGDWTTGNNATFGTAGSFAGSLDVETASPLDGKKSFKYTAAAGSQNDWAYFTVDISEYARGGAIAYTFDYTWDGEDDDIEIEIWDPTITNEYSNELNVLKDTTNDYKLSRNSRTIYAHPDTESQVIVGFHVKGAVSGGEELIFDNLKVTDDIGEIGSGQPTVIESFHATGHGGYAGVSGAYKPYFANIQKNNISSLAAITNDGTDGFIYTALKDHKVEINASINTPTSGNRACALMLNDLSNNDPIGGSQDANILAVGLNAQTNYSVNIGTSYDIKVGETISLKSDFNSSTVSSPNRQSITITATSDEKTTRFLSVPNGEKLKDNFAIKVPAITTNGTYDRATLLGLGLIDPYELVTAVSRGGAGGYTVAFRPIFSTPPICIAVANTVSTKIATAYNESTNSCEVLFEDTTSGVNFDGEFSLLISRPTTTPDIVGVPVSIQGQTHEQDSVIEVSNFAGYTVFGGSNNAATYSDVNVSKGSAMSWVNNTYFEIHESGLYHVSADCAHVSALNWQIVKNTYTAANRLASGSGTSETTGDNASSTRWLNAGDIVFLACGNPVASSDDTIWKLNIAKIGTQPLLDGGLVERPGEEIRVRGIDSYGSAGSNIIMTYNDIVSNNASSMRYVPDSVNGDYFEILEDGLYDVTLTFADNNAGGQEFGISKNASDLTASIASLPDDQKLFTSRTAPQAGVAASVSGSALLRKGDILRGQGHVISVQPQDSGDMAMFTVTKRGQAVKYSSRVYKEDPIAWQTKVGLTHNSVGIKSDLSFNNLEIGKTYRITFTGIRFGQVATDNIFSCNFEQSGIIVPGTNIDSRQEVESGSAMNDTLNCSAIFTATATGLDFRVSSVTGTGSQLNAGAVAQLEELPFHAQTSKWT